MACKSCKQAQVLGEANGDGKSVGNYIARVFVFLVMLVLTPVLMLFVIYVLFRTIVFADHVDMISTLKYVIEALHARKKAAEKDEDDEEEINPDDYELMDVEDIKE